MTRHVVATDGEIAPGQRKTVIVRGRPIVVFNHDGEYFAMLDRCPHSGAPLSHGTLIGVVQSTTPGEFCRSRPGEMLKCPWHGWEFDIRTGQSLCDPKDTKVRNFDVALEDGSTLSKGPYVAETYEVAQTGKYIVVTL